LTLLPAPDDAGADVRADVAAIIDEVRQDGDAALFAFTKRFDGVELSSLRVPTEEIDAPPTRDAELRAALEAAWVRICAYHRRGTPRQTSSLRRDVRHLIRPWSAPGATHRCRARTVDRPYVRRPPRGRVAEVSSSSAAPDGRVDDAT